MRAVLIPALVLMAFSAAADTRLENRRVPAEYIQTRLQQQDERIQALARRGRSPQYEQFLRAGIPNDGFRFRRAPPQPSVQALRDQARFEDITKREAAINLAALGYTAADVAAYREQSIDLFGIAHRLFSASASPEEQLLLADTILIATALDTVPSRSRLDGFLSTLPFKVTRALKGTPTAGEVVHLPQRSGTNPDGTTLYVSSDIRTNPGNTYLLILSKNWYEQQVAESHRQPETGFNALSFSVYEVSEDGALIPFPRPSPTGNTPRSIQEVEDELANSSIDRR